MDYAMISHTSSNTASLSLNYLQDTCFTSSTEWSGFITNFVSNSWLVEIGIAAVKSRKPVSWWFRAAWQCQERSAYFRNTFLHPRRSKTEGNQLNPVKQVKSLLTATNTWQSNRGNESQQKPGPRLEQQDAVSCSGSLVFWCCNISDVSVMYEKP